MKLYEPITLIVGGAVLLWFALFAATDTNEQGAKASSPQPPIVSEETA